ncbi:MAG: formate dehydrogenase accessory sulfurtransferase FdhD [Bacteroidetes bacterium]|nr:formate dehydrogenase accessory sulfurtransferase FdhD [Bacteroidota bacterium]
MNRSSHIEPGALLGQSIVEVPVQRVHGDVSRGEADLIAVEEPLEIRLGYEDAAGRTVRPISVTMRTPGHDVELAVGFLFTEGIIHDFGDVEGIRHTGPTGGKKNNRNVVTVTLKPGVAFDAGRLERHFYTTSSCGVCGKTSLDALAMAACPSLPEDQPVLTAEVVHRLPATLLEAQAAFERTGGLHAAALLDAEGRLYCTREDVGRHNALDKLIGAQLLESRLPLHDRILLVSGRASFELAQKALMAEIPVLAAVGAPSSLAVELAQRFGMTLLGFVRDGRFNVYSGSHRVRDLILSHGQEKKPVKG